MTSDPRPAGATPRHHPPEWLLFDHATGAADQPHALIVATHLALCPHCRAEVQRMEALGGALLDRIPPAEIADDAFDRVMAAIDAPPVPSPAPSPAATRDAMPEESLGPDALPVPRPLRDHVGGDLTRLPWRSLMPGLAELRLPIGDGAVRTRLLRARSGRALPQHSHRGNEIVLVLQGAFIDGDIRIGRGDLAVSDGGVDHRPLVEEGADCICLVVTDAPLRLTGPLGRLVDPIVRF